MNSIKKAPSLISPEPLLNARRSSLPLSFDNAAGQSPLIDLVKKFNFSQRNLAAFEQEGSFHVPQIVFQSPLPTNVSPCSSNTNQSPLNIDENESHETKGNLFRHSGRRASCEATFFASSPVADSWAISSPWTKRTISYCKSFSPVQCNANELSKRISAYDEYSPNRTHQCLHFPSLSPCFEDKPKQNRFPFQTSKNKICDGKIGNNLDCKQENLKGIKRRESLHDFFSPTSHICHEGKLTPKTKYRRNSHGTTSVHITSPSYKTNNVVDLQRGNPNLLINKRNNVSSTILGKGGFGIVQIGNWRGEKVAIKILKGRKALASAESEESSLKFGPHLNLVQTKAMVISKDSSNVEIKYLSRPEDYENEMEDIRSYILPITSLSSVVGLPDVFSSAGISLHWSLVISELCTSDNLLSLINFNSPISDRDKLRFLYQIASALKHMHEVGFAHLDVKPSNCFLTASGVIKLGDFGCTCKLNDIPSKSLGTVAYQAPEALGGKPVTDRCDIYSLGITTWQLLTQEVPYAGEHPHVIIYKVTRMNHRPSSEKQIGAKFIEDSLFSLAARCWSVLPSERPAVDTFVSIVTTLFFACSLSPMPKLLLT